MESKELVPQADEVETVTVPDMVRQALASGRGAEEMEIAERMLQLQMRWEENERVKAFAQAKVRLHFPPIPKTRRGAGANYAPYEEVQEIIEPIYQAEGFDLSFDASDKPDEKGGITVFGILLHAQGHQEVRHIWQPIGTVSKMMNPNQALVSATSYGQRALAKLIFNLKFIGVDNDADTFSTIDERQILTLQKLMEECKMGPESKSKFLTLVKAKTLSDILQGEQYQAAFNWLLKKRKKVLEEAEAKGKKS